MNRNWNKIGAVGTLVGVLLTSFIGIAGLALMWWFTNTLSVPSLLMRRRKLCQ